MGSDDCCSWGEPSMGAMVSFIVSDIGVATDVHLMDLYKTSLGDGYRP